MSALGLTSGLMLLAHHVGYPLSTFSWWLCFVGVLLSTGSSGKEAA